MTTATNTQRQLYGIGVFEEEIVLSDFTGAGERRFVITQEQLMAFCRSEITFRPFPGLIWMQSDGIHDTFMFTLTAAQRTILYRSRKKLLTKKLFLPSIAVRATFDQTDHRVIGINLWCFAGRTVNADTVLYELPLPNLSAASLCLGSTERVFGHDVREAVEKTIFDTPFNHHNYLVGRERLPFHDYVKKYKGKVPFHTLKRIGKGAQLLEAKR